ncbi:MAG TPA: hypothetical protein VGW77_37475 [Candidatus Binatia bacterium]|nr:hypothetical protein [Candidatus Binatia bacterium]
MLYTIVITGNSWRAMFQSAVGPWQSSSAGESLDWAKLLPLLVHVNKQNFG